MNFSRNELYMFRHVDENTLVQPGEKVFEYTELHLQSRQMIKRKITHLSAKHFYALLAKWNRQSSMHYTHTWIYYTDKYYE